MRVFIAIELPEKVKEALADLQRRMQPTPNRIKWVDPSSIHLTLKFLGEIKKERLSTVSSLIQELSGRFQPFVMRICGVGVFPGVNRARVIWVGVEEGKSRLTQMVEEIEKKLVEQGFPRERRKWIPHLTLARIKDLKDKESIKKMVSQEKQVSVGEVEVEAITVMQSRLTPEGAIYTPLQKAFLGEKREGA